MTKSTGNQGTPRWFAPALRNTPRRSASRFPRRYVLAVGDLDELRERFAAVPEFAESPLYTALAHVVAQEESLLRLAGAATRGQYPTFLFLGSIHYLLLGGIDHDLASFYPSVVGDVARRPDGAGPSLISFCREYQREILELLQTRLVQTNAVQRSLALRLGLVAVARDLRTPVHLIEIGASAGIHLRFDRFGYALGEAHFGNADSRVQIEAELIGGELPPDLDDIPPIASRNGVDLHPLDVRDPDDRRWLEALVWPDNQREANLLHEALGVVAADPPSVRAGNAIDICPRLAAELPGGEPRLVFTVATRMHVPNDQLDAFDAAINSLGENAPLYLLTLDRPLGSDPRRQPARPGGAIYLRDPAGTEILVAVAGARIEWVEPVAV
jgi:hypothetical protein